MSNKKLKKEIYKAPVDNNYHTKHSVQLQHAATHNKIHLSSPDIPSIFMFLSFELTQMGLHDYHPVSH